jgi:membrane-bound lytic murein transglycosylase B
MQPFARPENFLRQHPATVRRGALGSIAVGVALFVSASVTSAIAAPAAHRVPTVKPVAADVLPSDVYSPPATATVAPAPAPVKRLSAKPIEVPDKAPATSAVISSLAANGIPTVALNAYRVAAARMKSADPSCGIDWALLAGIGREESDHGRFGGAVLHADGISTPEIIGPALDGKHWDYVSAPADGLALDGDARYAHALGPMQFIPSTWAEYGVSASGHGTPNIFNINDAALTAARYLCAAGGNLRTTAGQTRAVLAYNHNDQYLAQVLALAAAYRSGVRVTGIPQGITTGSLPRVKHTGTAPPANPGGPTAVVSGTSAGTKKTSGKTSTASSKTGKTSTSGKHGSSATAPSSGKSSSSTTPSPSPTPPSGSTKPTSPGTSTSPTATPSPSPTCAVPLGNICLVK